MSRGSYMPGRESDQIDFLQNLSMVVGGAAASYGVTPALMTTFGGDVAALVVLFN